jgi:hypothetical protein
MTRPNQTRKRRDMSDPNENNNRTPEDDDLELEPEVVKDLDVGDDEVGQIRGGCSWTPFNRV